MMTSRVDRISSDMARVYQVDDQAQVPQTISASESATFEETANVAALATGDHATPRRGANHGDATDSQPSRAAREVRALLFLWSHYPERYLPTRDLLTAQVRPGLQREHVCARGKIAQRESGSVSKDSSRARELGR